MVTIWWRFIQIDRFVWLIAFSKHTVHAQAMTGPTNCQEWKIGTPCYCMINFLMCRTCSTIVRGMVAIVAFWKKKSMKIRLRSFHFFQIVAKSHGNSLTNIVICCDNAEEFCWEQSQKRQSNQESRQGVRQTGIIQTNSLLQLSQVFKHSWNRRLGPSQSRISFPLEIVSAHSRWCQTR